MKNKIVDCCDSIKNKKKCKRRKDGKIFTLPRRFPREKCLKGVRGFTMRSSCAPFKNCKKGGAKKTRKI